MRFRLHSIPIIIALLPSVISLSGQQNHQLFLQHDIPQSVFLNPAAQISCRFVIGIPLLGNMATEIGNSSFTYAEADRDGSLDLDGIYRQLGRNNMASVQSRVNLVFAGYRRGRDYFNFTITDRAEASFTYPRSIASLTLYGNRQFVGEELSIRNLRPGGYYLREYGLGYSRLLGRHTYIGGRIRLMFGKAGLTTGRSRASLYTDPLDYALTADGELEVNASLPVTIMQDGEGRITGFAPAEISLVQFLLNRGNPGLGFDAGIIHEYNEKTTLSASILGSGIIRWRTGLNSASGALAFSYEGVDGSTSLTGVSDVFDLVNLGYNETEFEVTDAPFYQLMPVTVLMGADYAWKNWLSFGTTGEIRMVSRFIQPSVSVMARLNATEHFGITAGLSYRNRSIKHAAVSLAYRGRGLQFYLATDNLIGLLYPFDTRTLDFSFGVNLMLGCPRTRWERHEEIRNMPEGRCGWMGSRPSYLMRKNSQRNRR